jgi:acyl carrier protein
MADASRSELRERIKEIMVERLKLDRTPESIGDDEPLFAAEGLGRDSIDALELVLGIEQEYDVKIENEEVGMEALSSVTALADFIVAKKPSLVAP